MTSSENRMNMKQKPLNIEVRNKQVYDSLLRAIHNGSCSIPNDSTKDIIRRVVNEVNKNSTQFIIEEQNGTTVLKRMGMIRLNLFKKR